MSVELRLPQINADTPREELVQLKSYLYQLVEELNWALNNIEPTAIVHSETINGEVIRTEDTPSQSGTDLTFGVLKDLIIKSADIVNAYYEKIDVLLKAEGYYVAQSDFGTYQERTSAEIVATNRDVTELFTKSEEVDSRVEGIESGIRETEAYIRTGELATDVYGVEVGQTTTINNISTFRAFARFTPTRLSFYDENSIEVAYISNQQLYITDAVITHNLNIGQYIIKSDNGLAFIFKG